MAHRARDGASLEALIRKAIPLLREAERQCPRTGRGAKPQIPDWFLGLLIMAATLPRKKSKSAPFRWFSLPAHQRTISALTGQRWFPARSTFFDRYRRAHHLFRQAIAVQGQRAIAEGVTDPAQVAADKSLVVALGPVWHQRDRRVQRVPRGTDVEAAWGYSEHHGWVYGYSFEVVVSATRGTVVFPLLASVDVASAAETKTFVAKIDALPPEVRTVLADSGYDANALGEQVEYDARQRRTGRRFLCPENPRNHGRKKTKPGGADQARARSRKRRAQRKKFLESPTGRRWYRRRGKTVEPFNSWFKSLFEIDERVWHRGLKNNQTQLLANLFVYQLLVRDNFRRGRKHAQIKAVLDAL